jgi:methionyl-tRNA synthetase
MSKRILVTSALPYANGPIHLGHLAGAYLPADLYTRYKRLRGEDIIHICGSDEHGVPITIAAEKKGVHPQQIVDEFHERNKTVFKRFGIDFDYYGRTSSRLHHETSQDFFTKLNEKGIFIKKTEKQLFDPKADMFLPDRYVTGTCPVCGHEEAYGDQCEKCGSSLSPVELINPKSVLTGNTPVTKETEHWYLPLGKLQPDIESWIESRVNWKANVLGQCRSWLNEGLNDRAVTRDLTWGVPVPLEGTENKVLYVWFDAPIGYISATKEWAIQKGDKNLWKKYWQDNETSLIHFIGKDNIVFHCIMFPLMLMKYGEFVLPENVPANEFLNLEGRKLSTSKGWAVWLEDYLDTFEPDLLRYVLGSTLPETKDSDFSWKDFQTRINSELADILGNFIFRSLSFTDKYFNGIVPELINPGEKDIAALNEIENSKKRISESYEKFRFREAIAETMNLARTGNKYFTDTEPWKTRKVDLEACGNTLHVSIQICAALSVLFRPVLPEKMKELASSLNLQKELSWEDVNSKIIDPGTKVTSGEILFAKIEDEVIDAEFDKLRESSASESDEKAFVPLKKPADYKNFASLDLRVGQIIHAEDLPESNKLLKLTVDLGFETRTILAGIKQVYTPEDIINKKVCVVANLEPKKMMGIESNGMVLMAEEEDGKLHFITTEADPGSPVF